MIYHDVDDLLLLASVALGGDAAVRELGLLESAIARPQASYAGEELYPTVPLKAAALMHSIAKNRALVDGNKRLALSALLTFLWMNGFQLTMSNDEAYVFTKQVASGVLDDAEAIAGVMEANIRSRR
ncbi:type II toxin-antitoxin system death-on-curing family toxin [Gryllotalpicola ginsengisoli]|uniref:type II toxin-antitoxin system death-on-curing family toxin n=1 Tax=Gryllotalpicola ginsengisoli TaxID=444608 RepID=UPI0003B4FE0D|nr:type II toxin-antitoxin system death-on-curing family toxin [Gryllotalpicola ginsengisoli]